MEMIRVLPKRLHKDGFFRSWGVFKCAYCGMEVEKMQHFGFKRQSCGCVAGRLTWEKRRQNHIHSYEVKGDVAYFKVKNNVEFIVDVQDIPLVKDICWSMGSHGYMCNTKHGLLHRFLTGFQMTDHQDGNKLNNSRSNLRPCNNQQNQWNKKKCSGFSSKFKGVHYRNDTHKWSASIEHSGKRYYLGCYVDEELAAKAYDTAAKRLFGDFARLNIPH